MEKQKIASIYKIQNKTNGKCYIGFSSKNYKRRWKSHIKGGSHCIAINAAIALYGVDNFIFEVICQSKDAKYLLTEMEPYFIKKYDSFGPNGYNLTEGGEGVLGYKHTEDSLKIIRAKRAIQIFSKEKCEKHRQHGYKGTEAHTKRFTEETRSKLSISQSNRMKNGYNPKATKWIVKDNKNNLQEITKPTTHFGSAFKSFWASHRDNRPIQRGNYEGWQLIEIVKL